MAGFDPGSIITGYGVLVIERGKIRVLESGCIKTGEKLSLADKLKQIYDDACSVINEYNPEEVVIENAFYAKNIRTTLVLGHVRGALMLAGKNSSSHIVELTPREIKKFVTGNGAASKESVQYMVGRHLNIRTESCPPDATDAVAAALAHALCITKG